jgi:hypothetical protein
MSRSGSGGSNAQCKLRGHCTVLRLPAMSSVSSARFQWAVGHGVQAVASLKDCSPSTQHMPYTLALACSCRWRPRGREVLAHAREGALLQTVSRLVTERVVFGAKHGLLDVSCSAPNIRAPCEAISMHQSVGVWRRTCCMCRPSSPIFCLRTPSITEQSCY